MRELNTYLKEAITSLGEVIADEIKFKFVKTEYAANVLRNVKVSKFDGYYYQVKG